MEQSQTQEIKNRVDIVEVVRESIPHLKPAGGNWKGLCPFHNEKTPSFMVSQDKQIWHCFGCNEGGDVFTFLMKIQNIEFVDALRQLADRAGIVLERTDPAKASLRNTVLDIHTHAREYFTKTLLGTTGTTAREYVKKRGVTKELVLELGLGLATDTWDALYKRLITKGFSNKQILASGLVSQNEKGKYYDRFRDRLMFSLIDAQGQIAGFAGRTLKNDAAMAKYINSPQTILYNKSDFLYGFYQAKQSIREENLVIIVEGYFDWIALYRNGYTNAVAVSGTALTDEHLTRLKRYTRNIAFALDTDEAGARALKRSVGLALSHECTPFIVDYKQVDGKRFKDPDELLESGKDLFAKVLGKKELALAYYIRMADEGLRAKDVERQKSALATIFPLLRVTKNAIDREHFIQVLSTKTGISADSILVEIGKEQGEGDAAYAAMPKETAPVKLERQTPQQERRYHWIALLLSHPTFVQEYTRGIAPEDIEDEAIRTIFEGLLKLSREGTIPGYAELKQKIPITTEVESWLLKLEELYSGFPEEDLRKEIALLSKKIQEDHLRSELAALSRRISEAEDEQDEKKVAELVARHQKMTDTLIQLLH